MRISHSGPAARARFFRIAQKAARATASPSDDLAPLMRPWHTKSGESDRFSFARYGLFRRNIMVGKNAWAPPCGARTRAGGSCLARVVVGPQGPRSRCRMHGGHLQSGKQTPEGRKSISDAMQKRMRAFWSAWREAGKPPLPWRESLRTAKPRAQPTIPSAPAADERRARVIAELKRRWPDRDWS